MRNRPDAVVAFDDVLGVAEQAVDPQARGPEPARDFRLREPLHEIQPGGSHLRLILVHRAVVTFAHLTSWRAVDPRSWNADAGSHGLLHLTATSVVTPRHSSVSASLRAKATLVRLRSSGFTGMIRWTVAGRWVITTITSPSAIASATSWVTNITVGR